MIETLYLTIPLLFNLHDTASLVCLYECGCQTASQLRSARRLEGVGGPMHSRVGVEAGRR